MKLEDARAADRLDPEDPSVYLNEDKVILLDPVDQAIARLNLALDGKGDSVRQVEAELIQFGYNITFDGVLDTDELAALDHYKRQLKDADFRETALELISMAAAGMAETQKLYKPAAVEEDEPVRKQTIVSDPF